MTTTPKINALAEQANTAFHTTMGEGADKGQFYFEGFADIFAKLIIKECLQCATPDDTYQDDWFKAKADVYRRIKERFGLCD